MDNSQQRLTRKQRRDLRALERDLELDPRLAQAFAGLPKVPPLQRISPLTYVIVGIATIAISMVTGQGFAFLVGWSCVVVGIIFYRRRDLPQPLIIEQSPKKHIDPYKREP